MRTTLLDHKDAQMIRKVQTQTYKAIIKAKLFHMFCHTTIYVKLDYNSKLNTLNIKKSQMNNSHQLSADQKLITNDQKSIKNDQL